jgi:hypothetical protein
LKCEKKYLEILDHKYLFDSFKLRTRNHKLPIECGRWQGIERNRRLCKLYQKQEIGDEFEYILECPFFKCFQWGSCYSIFSFMGMFCRSLFVFSGVRVTRSLVLCVYFVDLCLSFCSFSLAILCCLFFFDLRILITPLISSTFSFC